MKGGLENNEQLQLVAKMDRAATISDGRERGENVIETDQLQRRAYSQPGTQE
jgi:hypothetical protein